MKLHNWKTQIIATIKKITNQLKQNYYGTKN